MKIKLSGQVKDEVGRGTTTIKHYRELVQKVLSKDDNNPGICRPSQSFVNNALAVASILYL